MTDSIPATAVPETIHGLGAHADRSIATMSYLEEGSAVVDVPPQRRPDIQAALVKVILEQWRSYKWTVQGFGMVRTKIANVGRIHVWDSSLRSPRVSDIHAHPWDLCSRIISGELINQRFRIIRDKSGQLCMPYTHSRIKTGEGGGLTGDVTELWLDGSPPEFYTAGDLYHQAAAEVHRTIPIDGTVTLLERAMGEPLQETDVYWPRGTAWVSAEPREAQAYETQQSIEYALSRWHSR